jgi:hypothetical protein
MAPFTMRSAMPFCFGIPCLLLSMLAMESDCRPLPIRYAPTFSLASVERNDGPATFTSFLHRTLIRLF